jgi:ribose transport system substrate-binding protein
MSYPDGLMYIIKWKSKSPVTDRFEGCRIRYGKLWDGTNYNSRSGYNMKYKKAIKDITVILLMLIFFMVWHRTQFRAVPAANLSGQQIYLITMDKVDQFWYSMDRGARDMAELIGVTYHWDAPATRDVQEQINIFNNAVEDGADAILLAASDPVRISGAVEDAKAKGVRIIYVDAPSVEEATVTLATENYSAGKIAGQTMIAELEDLGIQRGTIGIIGVTPENITTNNRERGFREVFRQDGRFMLLDTVYTDGNPRTSRAAVMTMIEDNIDLIGVFATNEGSTVGVGNAINISGKKLVGVGFDMTEEIQKMLADGILHAVMVQNPYTMGYLGMAEAVAAIRGFPTGPSFLDTGVSVITKYQPRGPLVN